MEGIQAHWHPTHPEPNASDRVRIRLDDGRTITVLLQGQGGRVVGEIRLPPGARLDIDRANDQAAVIWLRPDRRPSGRPLELRTRLSCRGPKESRP